MRMAAILSLLWGLAKAQCPGDTIPLIAGWVEIDTLAGDGAVPCFPYQCDAAHCHLWHLPDSLNGIVHVHAPNGEPVNVQFWHGCDSILLDTCVVWDDPTNAIQFAYNWVGSTQVQVCGVLGTEVHVTIKALGLIQHPMHTPMWDADTLCPVLGWFPIDYDWSEPEPDPAKPCWWNPVTGEYSDSPGHNQGLKQVDCRWLKRE